MRKFLTLFIALILSLSNLSAQFLCASNKTCETALNLCVQDTMSYQCAPCSMGGSPALWFEFTTLIADSIPLNVLDMDGNSNHFSGYELYGPLNSSDDCDNLPSPSASSSSISGWYFTYITSGRYLLKVDLNGCADTVQRIQVFLEGGNALSCDAQIDTVICENCVQSFAPIPGKKYVLSAWVKEESAALTKTTYNYPEIYIDFPSIATTLGPFSASGEIIDGWQRIEEEFTIPISATDIDIRLESTSGNVFFDDIRIFPFDASMKSYVYDPVNMRLAAELDERHYSTFYEYDEEGKLLRIKKETEKGVMTIQETRNNNSK